MFIEELLSKINRREQISYDFYIKKDKSEFVGPTKPTKKQLKYIDDLLLLDKLKKSNINFYKFGWVNEAAKLLNIKIQHINKFLKRLDPEFYSTCYVRSTFVGPPKPNTDQIRESKIYTKLKNLKESNVDFTNKKWTKEASIILDIPSNRVRSWIRKHDPEYFNYIKEAK